MPDHDARTVRPGWRLVSKSVSAEDAASSGSMRHWFPGVRPGDLKVLVIMTRNTSIDAQPAGWERQFYIGTGGEVGWASSQVHKASHRHHLDIEYTSGAGYLSRLGVSFVFRPPRPLRLSQMWVAGRASSLVSPKLPVTAGSLLIGAFPCVDVSPDRPDGWRWLADETSPAVYSRVSAFWRVADADGDVTVTRGSGQAGSDDYAVLMAMPV